MRIATWNVQWATPGSARGDAVRRVLEATAADVVVTTEDHASTWDRYPHAVDAGADWGYPVKAGRRKVIARSTAPWHDICVIDEGAARGRLVVGTTSPSGEAVTVVAVCGPWSGAHVSTGRRDRRGWDEHVEFCARLGEVVSSVPGPVVVVGDFNQAVPRVRQPKRVFEALVSVLGGFDVVTGGRTEVGPLIDHVACGPGLVGVVRQVWPNVVDGLRVSDHSGVAVDIERAVRS